MTKVAALNSSEADWWENPPADVWPILAANPDVQLARVDPLASPIMLRFNLQPPFDNPKARQAVLSVIDQADFLAALAGKTELGKMRLVLHLRHADVERRRQRAVDRQARLRQGEADARRRRPTRAKIVVMDAVDQPVAHTEALVITEVLKKLGMNVDLQAMVGARW
jgi:peptide/nickel transport system substrate-binding protein